MHVAVELEAVLLAPRPSPHGEVAEVDVAPVEANHALLHGCLLPVQQGNQVVLLVMVAEDEMLAPMQAVEDGLEARILVG